MILFILTDHFLWVKAFLLCSASNKKYYLPFIGWFNRLFFTDVSFCVPSVMELTPYFGDWSSSYSISQCEGRGTGRDKDREGEREEGKGEMG